LITVIKELEEEHHRGLSSVIRARWRNKSLFSAKEKDLRNTSLFSGKYLFSLKEKDLFLSPLK